MSVSAEFDATFYLTNNADVVLAISQGNFANGLDHYNQFGGRELRAPNSTFDPNYYAINNSDVLSAVSSGVFPSVFAHFQAFGETENRAPNTAFASFDAAGYLAANADVAAAVTAGTFSSALDHFISFGQNENRSGSGVSDTSAPGETFTLATTTDNISGGDNADSISGYINTTTATTGQSTLTGSDIVNGGAGTDTFSLIVEGANGVGSLTAAAISNMETFVIRDINTSGASTYDFSTLTGETTVTSDRSSQDVTFSNVAAGTTVGMSGTGAGALTATYAGTGATAANLAISSGTSAGAIAITHATTATTLTSLSITSSGSANTVGAISTTDTGIITTTVDASSNLTATSIAVGTNASAQSLVVNGSATTVSIGTLDTDFATVNASGMTAGGITATMGALATATVTGGAGADSITTGVVLTTGSVNAGEGTDVLTIAASAHLTATLGAKYTNFETLGVADGQTVDMDHISGITAVRVTDASNAATVVNDMSATQAANVTFRDLEQAATLAVKGAATVGQIDVVSITIDDGDTTGSENISATAGVLTLANVETLNVNAVDDAELVQSAATSGSLNSVTLTGSGNHSFTTGNMAQGNFNLNASATTAANTLDASTFATNGIAIQGGSAVDTITGSSQADAITGNAGNDIINNQATAAVATAAADVLTGGAGDDTFTLTGSIASTTVYTGVANVTDFTVATTAAGSDKIRFASDNGSYAAGLSVDGTAAGATGAVVVLNVAQSAGATDSSADAIAENFIKLTQSVAFDTNNQTTFNNAIGTSTVTNMTAGTYAASFHDATNDKMVLVEVVTTATAATTLQTGDAVRLIGTIDMTAADYANIDADNFANFV